MDEWTLNDLLECSVCLERLDTSSKVLPCQHTFCKKCLEDILSSKKELRCPECRVLVETGIDDLPPNVLLMRILEGMRNAGPKRRSSGTPAVHHQRSHSQPVAGTLFPSATLAAAVPAAVTQNTPVGSENIRTLSIMKQVIPSQPYARAVYDYISKEPGDLSFKKGDIITLRKQVDQNWYHGEIGGVHGVFPLCYVQIIPTPANVPQCKALYDFKMTNDEEEGCLSFTKGEIITVIRRVDENWAEGRYGDKVGIFPIAFVEMNGVARAFMKLSSNIQPGPSRIAPPTPTSEEMTPLIPTDHSVATIPSQPLLQCSQPGSQSQQQQLPLQPPHRSHVLMPPQQSSQTLSSLSTLTQPQSQFATSSVAKPPSNAAANFINSSSSTSSSSTTPNTSSTSSSSSSSTTPSSPASPPPRPSAWSPQIRPSRPTGSSTNTTQESSQSNQQKRHSLSTILAGAAHHSSSNRHSAEVLGSTDATEVPENVGDFVRQGSGRNHRRSGSSELPLSCVGSTPPPLPQGIHPCPVNNSNLPATYIALYPYKPQKADELELRKGGVYTVTERCQDGWFKGTSNRTQKSGVFPGNYVAFVKSLPANPSQLRLVPRGCGSSNTPVRSASSSAVSPTTGTASTTVSPVSYTREKKASSTSPQTSSLRPQLAGLDPPSLPPRSVSPAQTSNTATASSVSWLAHQSGLTSTSTTATSASPSTSPQATGVQSSQSSLQASSQSLSPPNPPTSVLPTSPAGTPSKSSSDKAKEKKERGSVSLMRRLTTNIKKSKSPPPPYSMDNPVFEDGSVLGSTHTTYPAHPIHVRSGSCPSQLLQLPQPESLTTSSNQQSQPLHHRPSTGLVEAGSSQWIRQKERPSVVMTNLAHSGRLGDVGGVPSASAATVNNHHRKSNSLDAGNSHSSSNGHNSSHAASNGNSHGESSRKCKQLVQPARERFRCVVPYPPHSEYELELRVGDVIYVHRKREDGWYKGTQQRTGRTGLFPASFVEAF